LGDPGCNAGFNGIGFGSSLTSCTNYSLVGDGTDTVINRASGGTLYFREANTTQMTIGPGGFVTILNLGSAGGTQLCHNGSNQIVTCGASSIRYKENVVSVGLGLDLVRRLRPVSFRWKEDGQKDLGLIAEEVNEVEPLLVTRNAAGDIVGVKYQQLNVVLINAIRQQQAQIENQQTQIESLKKLVCLDHPNADVCK
jgi:hypothetical protein